MSAERAVTRWYARRQMIQNEIATQQARLEQLRFDSQTTTKCAEAEQQLATIQTRLRDLGPCPRPMMG
ncbi:MAG: hypothetical protein ABI234_12305 [Ktedonobacteraceae bacterium]